MVWASIRLEDVCTGAVLAAIQDPSLARLPAHEVPLPLPRASLGFAEGEDTRIVQHLASIGLLEFIDESLVWEHQGSRLLSGLFGVEKRGEIVSAEDERTKLRPICNLKSSNVCQFMRLGAFAMRHAVGWVAAGVVRNALAQLVRPTVLLLRLL